MISAGMVRRWLGLTAAAISLLGSVETASAASGVIAGTWTFFNKNSGFCPNTNACAGAAYTQAAFEQVLPISNAMVWVIDPTLVAPNNVIGTGFTEDNGDFSVPWMTDPTVPAPMNVEVLVLSWQRDGRFFLANPGGQITNVTSGPIAPVDGTSAAMPQRPWATPLQAGNSALPDPFFNAYWALEFEWRTVFKLVGILDQDLTNVEMRGFQDTMAGYHGTRLSSAAFGPDNQIQFDANAAFNPQARAMHEYGHIASYVTNPAFRTTGAYDWSQKAEMDLATMMTPVMAGGTWDYATSEWASVAFEEAFATHYGNIAFWNDDADTPTSCSRASGNCYTPGAMSVPVANADVEASSFSACDTTATAPESRRAVSAMRYLWDVYDNRNDNMVDDAYTANAGSFWQHLAVLASYGTGHGANEINEPYSDDALSIIMKPDGRGSSAYRTNYQTASMVDTAPQRDMNCTPP
ncbi:MAG TPA: hypothetical protein VFN67_14470 [Polyangiales bacterium]|nr:hypothetical protein [Polyangiales bacterium]